MCENEGLAAAEGVTLPVDCWLLCSQHFIHLVKSSQGRVCESTAQFQILAERVNGIYSLKPGCNLIHGFRKQWKGAGKPSHPGNTEMVTTAEDILVFSGQRH